MLVITERENLGLCYLNLTEWPLRRRLFVMDYYKFDLLNLQKDFIKKE
jgi:hypothetical protein